MNEILLGLLTATSIILSPQEKPRTENPRKQVVRRPVRQAPQAPKFQFHSIEEKLIAATNQERARNGLPPLRVDHSLMRSARRHAAWMTNRRSLRHTSAMVAENIAMGQRSVPGVIRSWMSSPGHRANILGRGYSRIGVAAYRTPSGTIYWCQQFLR